MELIRKLNIRLNKTGDNKQRWGLFKCSYCLQEVERQLANGKRDKSCGCVHNELISKSLKGHLTTNETKQKISIGNIGNEWTQEQRINLSKIKKGKKNSKEHNKNISMGKKGKKLSEEHTQKLKESHTGKTGELSSNWQGGKSFEKYGVEFNKELKQQILERDNHTCQNNYCLGKTTLLQIHHIDYDKKNNIQNNLITLCISCHAKTNGKKKRVYWTTYYQDIIKIIYAY